MQNPYNWANSATTRQRHEMLTAYRHWREQIPQAERQAFDPATGVVTSFAGWRTFSALVVAEAGGPELASQLTPEGAELLCWIVAFEAEHKKSA